MEAMAQKKSELPKSIQDQSDAADAAMKSLAEGTLVEVEKPKPDPEPEKPAAPVKEPEKPVEDSWEHKYQVLEGMFKRKAKEDADKIDQLAATVQNLNDLLVQKGPVTPPKKEDEPAGDEETGTLNVENFEGYGGEMVEMVELVNSLVEENKRLKSLSGRVDEMGSTVEKVGASFQETESERFYSKLTEQVEDWRTINVDPAWLAWLDEHDPRSAIWRQTLLDDAFKSLDVSRVAVLFNDFIKETNWQKPVSSEQTDRPGKEDLVVPDTGPAPDMVQETPKAITAAEYKQAAVDFTQGRITEEQYKKISDNFQRSLAKGK